MILSWLFYDAIMTAQSSFVCSTCPLTKLYIHHCDVTSWVFSLHLIFQNGISSVLTLCLITPIKRVDFFVMQFVSNKHDWECSIRCRLCLMQGFNSVCNYSFSRHFSHSHIFSRIWKKLVKLGKHRGNRTSSHFGQAGVWYRCYRKRHFSFIC